MPWIAGGCMKNTRPFLFDMNFMLPRVAIEAASSPSRSAKSLSLMNTIALRWPEPPKPKPSAANTLSAVSFSS